MNEYIETIKKSMQQTENCQGVIKELFGYCRLLIDKVKELQVENEELKKELKNGIKND